MQPAELREIGEFLHGPRWQTKLARDLKINSRTVRRYLSGAMPIRQETDMAIRSLLPESHHLRFGTSL